MKLLITNLSPTTSELQVESFFRTFGPHGGVRLLRNRATGRSRGQALLATDAAGSRELLHKKELILNGRRLTLVEFDSRVLPATDLTREPVRTTRLLY